MDLYKADDLVALLAGSEENLTARAYIGKIARHLGIRASAAKKILRTLVNDQKVTYQDLYGSTYVMESFLKPVRITDRFFIVPPGMQSPASPGTMNIRIFPGISFGSGHHPTTCLCLEALDRLFFDGQGADRFPGRNAGDVGTGSGILAIAACLGGMERCTAWEIDANAVSEAQKNVGANHLDSSITVVHDYMPPADPPLALICANLRYPTLKQLAPLFKESLLPGGYLVLSGLRSWERDDLVAAYQALGFSLFWEKTLKHWTGLILGKGS